MAHVGKERRLHIRCLDGFVARLAVGIVELDQVSRRSCRSRANSQTSPITGSGASAITGEWWICSATGARPPTAPHQPGRPMTREAAPRAMRRERARSEPGDREVDGELSKERRDEQERRRGRRGEAAAKTATGPIDHQAFPSDWIRREGRTLPLMTSGARTTTGEHDRDRDYRDRQREEQRDEGQLRRHREAERRIDAHQDSQREDHERHDRRQRIEGVHGREMPDQCDGADKTARDQTLAHAFAGRHRGTRPLQGVGDDSLLFEARLPQHQGKYRRIGPSS